MPLNQRGSAILPVILLSAAALATVLIILQNSSAFNEIYARKANSTAADNVAQLIGAIVSEPSVCLNGFDQAPGAQDGVQFLPAATGSSGTFVQSAAATASGQNISVPSPVGAGRIQAGSTIPGTNLTVNKIYVANSVLENPAIPNVYNTQLIVEYQSAATLGLSPRTAVNLQVKTTSAGAILGCGLAAGANSNKTLCEGMGCTYTVSSAGNGNCFCKIQPITCTGGTYISSITGLTPVCSGATIQRTCAPATNQFLVALDSSGNPICGTVDVCPAGTQSTGLGAPATPASCKCANAGETWNGSACSSVVPINGVCGTANSTTRATAPSTAAELCTAGSPTAVTGSGPWNWTCNGVSGGSPSPLCSAAKSSGTVTLLCPDGVTQEHRFWSTISSCFSSCPSNCTYNPGATSSADLCNHLPVGSSCSDGSMYYTCSSSGCPGAASCYPGTSIGGAGGAAANGCNCTTGGQTWNAGTLSCSGAVASCTTDAKLKVRWGSFVEWWENTTTVDKYYGNPNCMVYGAYGTGDIYAKSTITNNSVTATVQALCHLPSGMDGSCSNTATQNIGGTNYTVTISYQEASSFCEAHATISPDPGALCTSGPPPPPPTVNNCGTGTGSPGWNPIGAPFTQSITNATFPDSRFQNAWSQWTNGTSGNAFMTMMSGQQHSMTWVEQTTGSFNSVDGQVGASHYSGGTFYYATAGAGDCTSARNGKYAMWTMVEPPTPGGTTVQRLYQCFCP